VRAVSISQGSQSLPLAVVAAAPCARRGRAASLRARDPDAGTHTHTPAATRRLPALARRPVDNMLTSSSPAKPLGHADGLAAAPQPLSALPPQQVLAR
jgi:hypothetical protein